MLLQQVDVTNLVRDSLKAADPDVARVLDGVVLQGRGVGTTVVQVSHASLLVCLRRPACFTSCPLLPGGVSPDVVSLSGEKHPGPG